MIINDENYKEYKEESYIKIEENKSKILDIENRIEKFKGEIYSTFKKTLENDFNSNNNLIQINLKNEINNFKEETLSNNIKYFSNYEKTFITFENDMILLKNRMKILENDNVFLKEELREKNSIIKNFNNMKKKRENFDNFNNEIVCSNNFDGKCNLF